MEDGGAGGDNHSDRHSDKLGNGIVYAMNKDRCKGKWVKKIPRSRTAGDSLWWSR